jgi:hypothetical protein
LSKKKRKWKWIGHRGLLPLGILKIEEEKVDEDTPVAEWQNKPYNMGKPGQELSGWQGIVYAGGICGGCVFQLGMTGR